MKETEAANQTLKSMKEVEDKEARMIQNGQDSPVDWDNLQSCGLAWNALYKLCKIIDCSSGNNIADIIAKVSIAVLVMPMPSGAGISGQIEMLTV